MQPDPREERGREIAKRGGIRQIGRKWKVPSQTRSDSTGYIVDLEEGRCTCPDYRTHGKKCKHLHSVEFWVIYQEHPDGSVTRTTAVVEKFEPPRNWSAINRAAVHEKEHVERLLRDLCLGVQGPIRKPGPGQNPMPYADIIFGNAMKIYGTKSMRASQTDLERACAAGLVDDAASYNTLFKYMQDPTLTPILTRLIEEASAPLAIIERGQFAQDSTGFSTVVYERHFDQKHGKLQSKHPWVKMHVMVGTLTNAVTAVKVSPEADCKPLPELLAATGKRFKILEVSADAAYPSKKNVEAVYAVDAVPFFDFKDNAKLDPKNPWWSKAVAYWMLNREEWFPHYHRRSNVETTFAMIKMRFGGYVRSRLPITQVNECLLKCLLHNLVCLNQAIYEHGLDPQLFPETALVAPPALTLVRP